MSRDIFSVGVDLGGTWIRLEAVDTQGKSVRSHKAPAPTLHHLPTVLKQRLRAWKTRPTHLNVASRGVWNPHERAHLKRVLRSLAKVVRVMSDVEAAWHAAFQNGTGIVVISGTGSIAYGRDQDGCARRTGGWGPLLGDEGSAFWIGRAWLKSTHRPDYVPPQSVRRVAALAPKVLLQNKKGHAVAKEIIREAQTHLAELVSSAAAHLHFKKVVPVSWAGSLLNNPHFRAGFVSALRRQKVRFELTTPQVSPALAMARLPLTNGN